MATQYLLVSFPEDRDVLADGISVGTTNHILMLPGDEYEITIDGNACAPASQVIALAGTSDSKPMVITFAQAAAVARATRGAPPAETAASAAPVVAMARARRAPTVVPMAEEGAGQPVRQPAKTGVKKHTAVTAGRSATKTATKTTKKTAGKRGSTSVAKSASAKKATKKVASKSVKSVKTSARSATSKKAAALKAVKTTVKNHA